METYVCAIPLSSLFPKMLANAVKKAMIKPSMNVIMASGSVYKIAPSTRGRRELPAIWINFSILSES